MEESIRLSEILTTASAVANFLGAVDVAPAHLLQAVGVLRGELALEDLGRPMSPLVARVARASSGATPEVREFAQRWFQTLGGDVSAEFSAEQFDAFLVELRALIDSQQA